MQPVDIPAVIAECAPSVHPVTASALIEIESSRNPYAIGVVHGALLRQPENHREAVATALALRRGGWSFSVGLAQINDRNLGRLGLQIESAFDPCLNLRAMQVLLLECLDRVRTPVRSSPRALEETLSCYYSGNVRTGFDHGYVQRVFQAAGRAVPAGGR